MSYIKDNLDEQEIMDLASAYIRDEGWVLEPCDEAPYDFIGFYHGRYDEPEKIAVVAFRAEYPNVTTELIKVRSLPDEAHVCFIRVDSGDICHITFNSLYYLRNFQFAHDDNAPKLSEDSQGYTKHLMRKIARSMLNEKGWNIIEKSPDPQFDLIVRSMSKISYSLYVPVRIVTTFGDDSAHTQLMNEIADIDYDNDYLIFNYNVTERFTNTSRLDYFSAFKREHEHRTT